MKTNKPLFLLEFIFLSMRSNSQILIVSNHDNTICYDQKEKKINFLEFGEINYFKTSYNNNLTYYPDQISENLKETTHYDFFQGIQNPHNSNVWVYMEREKIGTGFNLKLYNTENKKTQTLIEINNQFRKEVAFKPIGWTNNINELFLEGLYLNTANKHEGILIFNFETKKLTKIEIPIQFMGTSVISEDRNSVFFVGTLDQKIDKLHGNTNVVYEFNIQNKNLIAIAQSKGVSFVINGFKNRLSNGNIYQNSLRPSLLDYYLPWGFGKDNCLSRRGTPESSGTHINQGRCNIFNPGGQHCYAAVDFAASQYSDENVRAAAIGTVSLAGISGSLKSGYGRLVVITHSDETRTYYAHNTILLVSEGQAVSKGQILAREGTTGGSTRDHIHFEWRAAGGNVSKLNTGCTAANGYTTDANSNANTPVNYGATGLLSYTWPNPDTATANKPVVGNTYYWTVRSSSTSTGTCSYTPVRSFKVTSSTARFMDNSVGISKKLLFYPNPANDILNIEFKLEQSLNTQIEILGFEGMYSLIKKQIIPKKKSIHQILKLDYIF